MALTKVTTGTIADDSIQSLKNRNLIINGAMQVAQRGTQVTGVTTLGYRTCDRFGHLLSNLGTWTVDQSTDAPNGFSNSFKLTCTTADASPAAPDFCLFAQRIEAQNLQHLAFGTTGAKKMTLSFWVKSNKTGAATFDALQSDNSNKLFSQSYTINSADTWEYKTISIPADTAGVINNDNGIGLQISWWLNSGSDWSSGSHATTWSTYVPANRNPSNLGVGGAVSDYFAITGVQLEVGDVATPFEHESYGETLQKCLRYYEKVNHPYTGVWSTMTTGGYSYNNVFYSVLKRAAPTITNVSYECRNGAIGTTATASIYSSNIPYVVFNANPTSSSTGNPTHFYGIFEADAEL